MRSKNKKYKRKVARQFLRVGRLPAGIDNIKTLREMATREKRRP